MIVMFVFFYGWAKLEQVGVVKVPFCPFGPYEWTFNPTNLL